MSKSRRKLLRTGPLSVTIQSLTRGVQGPQEQTLKTGCGTTTTAAIAPPVQGIGNGNEEEILRTNDL